MKGLRVEQVKWLHDDDFVLTRKDRRGLSLWRSCRLLTSQAGGISRRLEALSPDQEAAGLNPAGINFTPTPTPTPILSTVLLLSLRVWLWFQRLVGVG